jgi:hypothetical protein
VVSGHSMLWADIAEDIQLLLVFSAHAFFLSGCAETREFRGTASASNRVFPQPAKELIYSVMWEATDLSGMLLAVVIMIGIAAVRWKAWP